MFLDQRNRAISKLNMKKKTHFNVIGLLPFLRAPFTVSFVEKTILQEILLYFTILGGEKFRITPLIPAVLPYLKKNNKDTMLLSYTTNTFSLDVSADQHLI